MTRQSAIGVGVVAGAAQTYTFPATTDTLVGRASTDTLTNKTYDTAGTGNSFSINGLAATANTGTGAVVRATSPTLVTPVLGAATGTSLNLSGLAISSAVATDASKNLVSVTNTGTGNNVLATSPTLVTPVLGAASGTSLNLSGLTASAAVATDGSKNLVSVTNTGTGNNVLATSPTLTTPVLGAATATSINFGGTSLANYAEGAWTPIDASGAGLVFTSVAASYTRIGNVVIATASLIYPATANGANAIIGGLPISGGGAGKNGGNILYTSLPAALGYILQNGGSGSAGTTLTLFTPAGAQLTNVGFSGGQAYIQIIYQI